MAGKIATLDPPYSPVLWTSVATGRRAWQHGILGFAEARPDGSGLQPITRKHLQSLTLPEILSQAGLTSATVGWWPSHPAFPVLGQVVSDLFFSANAAPPGAVFPESLTPELADLQLRPDEITPAILQPFFPTWGTWAPSDPIVQGTAAVLAKAAHVQAVATRLLESQHYSLFSVYFEAIDRFKHLAMQYMPPQMPGVSDLQVERYGAVVEAGYRFMDMCLERLLELAGPSAKVILLSDHGFRTGERRIELPNIPLAAALDHEPYGMVVVAGPGIPVRQPLFGASLLDVAPTVLTWLGLPTHHGMEGRVWRETCPQLPLLPPIPAPERAEMPVADLQPSLLHHLEDLGYLMPLSTGEQALKWLHQEQLLTRGRSLMEAGKSTEARKVLEEGYRMEMDPRFRYRLLALYLQAGLLTDAHALLQEPGEPRLDAYFKGLYLLQNGQTTAGWQQLEELVPQADGAMLLQMGRLALYRKHLDRAETFLKQAHHHQPTAETAAALARWAFLAHHFEDALSHVLQSLELAYHQPTTHALLAEITRHLGLMNESSAAWSVALSQAPHRHDWRAQWNAVRRSLGETIHDNPQAPVMVVSGLPRSGTSLVMNMLAAGGVELLEDGHRIPDEHNAEGYREDLRALKLLHDQQWLLEATGKAVKITVPHIQHLRSDVPIKVLFLQRPITDVVRSQEKMRGVPPEVTRRKFPLHLALQLENERDRSLSMLLERPLTEVLEVDYEQLLLQPVQEAEKIIRFLHLPPSAIAMAGVPKKSHA
jgi:tetratricopeptide (TPR) repeat protein